MFETQTTELTLEKTTKNTYRFEEENGAGQPPILQYLYLQKWIFDEEPPEGVRVTIEEI